MADLDWLNDAACLDHADPDLWFSHARAMTARAKLVCDGCPVREECLDYAVRTPVHYGVWGGLDEEERNRYRKRVQKQRRRSGLADEDVARMRQEFADGARMADLEERWSMSSSTVSQLVYGQRRPEAGGPIARRARAHAPG